MHASSLLRLRSLRVLFITLALALASTSAASADVLAPLRDAGGPGGGGGFGGQLDESARGQNLQALTTGIAISQLDESARAQALGDLSADRTPVLVGSGPERETVAQTEGPVLVGSGPERETVAQADEPTFVAETQNAGAIRRSESTLTETGALAGGAEPSVQPVAINGRGQVAVAETERALAQNALASVE